MKEVEVKALGFEKGHLLINDRYKIRAEAISVRIKRTETVGLVVEGMDITLKQVKGSNFTVEAIWMFVDAAIENYDSKEKFDLHGGKKTPLKELLKLFKPGGK